MILSSNDPPPYEIINPHGSAPFILSCEHAGNQVPENLKLLGLKPEDYHRHYAVDIGADALTRDLAMFLDAPAILGTYSRMVIELNRPLDHPTLFGRGDGGDIPGNAQMSQQDREARIHEIWEPYHIALDQLIEKVGKRHHNKIAYLSIHSFTRQFLNFERPWDITFLWVQDDRIARHGVRYFENLGYHCADNLPYDIQKLGPCSTTLHGDSRRIPNAYIEYRNDHIAERSDARHWAHLSANMLKNYTAQDAALTTYQGPEHTFDPAEEKQYISYLIEQAQQGQQG